MDRDAALSKHILLIVFAGVVVLGIITIFIFLIQPAEDVTPRFNATVESSGKTVYLYHDGGDPVSKGTIVIRINGEEVPQSAISFLHSQDWPWSVGKTLKVDYSGRDLPRDVQIVVVNGESRTMISRSLSSSR